MHFVNKLARCLGGQGSGLLIEHMFDSREARVSNMCSVTRVDGSCAMEMTIKVLLVGYLVYMVLGAPLLATGRGDSGRRMVR